MSLVRFSLSRRTENILNQFGVEFVREFLNQRHRSPGRVLKN